MAPNNGKSDTVSKPIGPFEDFDACVTHFEGDPDVDDPEALCGFLEQNKEALEGFSPEEDRVEDLIEALNDPEAEKVLQNLTVTHVSGVGDPAQDSTWVAAKDTEGEEYDWGVTAPLVLKTNHSLSRSKATPPGMDGEEDEDEDEEPDEDEEEVEQKAWAPVLIPNETDKQGDVIPPNEIEQAAHKFLANFRNIDTDHDLMAGEGVPIESWTLKQDTTFDLPDGSETREYPAGTWMMGVQFEDEAWERLKEGELSGFSIYGEAENVPVSEVIGGAATIERSATIELSKSGEEVQADLAPIFEAIEKEAEETGVEPEQILASILKEAWSEETVDSLTESEGTETDTTQDQTDMSDSETETETEEETEAEKEESTEESPDVAEMVKSIKSTVETNNEDLNEVQEKQSSLEDRVSDLEEEVNKEDTEETETEEEAEAEKEEAEESTEETEAEEAEKEEEETAEAVKSVLGIEDDLPEDPEERREVVRKNLAEPGEAAGDDVGGGIEFTEDDLEGVM